MTAPRILLHHYGSSPYAEKVRLALGLKDVEWGSVETSAVPPRPLLDPLTGGYRRIPVMQVGADIFCDTHAILPALDRLHPKPSLSPGFAPCLADALTLGFERDIWLAAIGVRVHFGGDGPAEFLRDRKEDYLYVDISHAAMEPDFPRNAQRVAAWVARLVRALSDGRRFLGGDDPGSADLGFFHVLWLMRNNPAQAQVDDLLNLAPILGWYDRVAAIGHGRKQTVSPEDALAAARVAEPALVQGGNSVETLIDARVGDAVTVTPDDFARKPVQGSLAAIDAERIVIAREDADLGTLHLHFPRAGFVVAKA
jgi:glutathione S-transferase